MKILHLTVKKKWFDMIASGEKKEEYREIKRYWQSRLCSGFPCLYSENDFDIVVFKNGYSKDSRSVIVKWLGMEIGTARPEWSDNWQGDVFVIKLGDIIPSPSTNVNKSK